MFRVAMIGYGYWGEKLTKKWDAIEGAELVYVCDIRPGQCKIAKGLYPYVETIEDYHIALDDPTIDAVDIATPIETHFEITRDALMAGKHVLVEKPMATSLHHVDELISIAREKELRLMAGHTFLYSPPVLKAAELIHDGELGKVEAVFMKRNNLGRYKKTGSVLWDLSPHDISILDYWLGEHPVAVQATGVGFTVDGVCDMAVMTLWFPSGAMASIQLSWKSPLKERDCMVIGSKKMLGYDDTQKQALALYNTTVLVDLDQPEENAFEYYQGEISHPEYPDTEPLMNECEHFMRCSVNGERPRADMEHARRVVQIIEKADVSLQNYGVKLTI